MILQVAAILVLLALGTLGLWQAAQAPIGLIFLLYLIPILLVLILVPLISYRAYALWRASYLLERDGIYLRWGLREEIIPMDVVIWVRSSQELETPLPLPRFRWPGAVLGVRQLPDGTRVEYIAAQASQFILVAASDRIYAISPANPQEFMLAYQRFAELGSLTPLTAHSIYPANLLRRVWAAPAARYLLIAGFGISILLLVLVSLSVPSNLTISLGFNPDGTSSGPVPSVYLLLLPILNGIFYFANALFGLYLFRAENRQTLAYLLWGSGLFTGLLFVIAVVLILTAS
ncbi:MAG: PH domain-containing protein [Anaerolineales bacterium]